MKLSNIFLMNLIAISPLVSSFVITKIPSRCTARSLASTDAKLETFDGTKGIKASIINEAAEFMMGSFWGVTDGNAGLMAEQTSDLDGRFGEILGKRKLFSSLIVAKSGSTGDDVAGIVGVEVALLDVTTKNILNYKQSDQKLMGAIASLGPKQRRQYKDASIEELVSELPDLAGKYEAVAVLANLAVAPSARGSGLGKTLCVAVERIVSGEWNMNRILLKVEGENEPARGLYEKMGYVEEWMEDDAITLRPDTDKGSFQDVPCTMMTLGKTL